MRGVTKVLKIFNIDIQVHYSWWFIFIFLGWVLTQGFFPEQFPGYDKYQYLIMGITSSLLLFVSVLFHELSHSLVAKARRIKVESITLFFFGGVAGITKEDIKPSSEFLMAIAGPLFSLVLSGFFYLIFLSIQNGLWKPILFYLAIVNLILAIFNFIPGFPLDGGRAFRAILYWHYKDLKKATKIASFIGRLFAGFMIIIGILALPNGLFNGLWFIFLGIFLYFIAGVTYQQVIMKEVLSKVSLKGMVSKKVPALKPEMKFESFIKKYSSKENDVFLVKEKGFMGVIDLKRLGAVPPKLRPFLKVKQVAIPIDLSQSINKNDNAYNAFQKFTKLGLDLLPVVDGKKLVGVLKRHVLMNRLQWELTLHGDKKKKIKKS